MPANHQKPALQTPASPRNTAKYTNKDGSKFITVPKGTASDSSQPSTPITAKPNNQLPPPVPTADDVSAPTVNRKKQKRRQKAAAKAAAEHAANGHHSPTHSSGKRVPADYEIVASDEDDIEYVLAEEVRSIPATNGHVFDPKGKKNKKKKKRTELDNRPIGDQPPPPPLPTTTTTTTTAQLTGESRSSGMSRDKIWSTSNHEERERIKEFWLGLGEDDRKSLVKVEKDAVLKKMKEQQKHTCSCTVCGRKRTAIEEELEGLYDAYYLELEQFANQREAPREAPRETPREVPQDTPRETPRAYPINIPQSTVRHILTPDFSRPPPPPHILADFARQPPSRGRIVEHVGDDEEEELEDVYSEDGVEDDDYSDDEPPEDLHSSHDRDVADFLTFGNSLQVKGTQLLESLLHRYGNMDLGGILTVADDLLKNDGKRFIEMMEQLAERRMAREEDAREHFSRGYSHPNGSFSNPHTHPPPEEDEYEEEEDEEEDYDDSQDEEYEEDEEVYSNPSVMPSKFHTECCCQDQMTEEQRMEEGRRMFQIFAARMFEQRVLSAYKEKVAKERQQKLLEELEEESRQADEQKARRAKNAQKKKDKAAQRKQALADEKNRKEAEKTAQEEARREAELRRQAEQKQRTEERRRQKEAQKKAEEDARLKREADRQRRLVEQKEKQAEQERKLREAKEREKKLKEEQRVKEKDAREQKEREAQERKEKQERDKREKEARAAKAQREAQEAAEARDKAKEEKAAQKASAQLSQSQPSQTTTKRGQQHTVLLPTALPQHSSNPATFASPKIPVATPVISKAPTPIRPRTTSLQQETSQANSTSSQSTSAPSQSASPHSMTPIFTSPSSAVQERKLSGGYPAIPPLALSVTPPGAPPKSLNSSAPFQLPPMGIQPPPGLAHHPPPPPGFPGRLSHDPIFPLGFRPGPSPSMMMPPPGINGPAGRGFPPVPMPPPGFSQPSNDPFPIGQGFSISKDVPLPTHRRQGSVGLDGILGNNAQPIGRPTPIGRPGCLIAGLSFDEDEDTLHLGSRALLDDDDPLALDLNPNNAFSLAPNPWGPPTSASQPFPPPGFGNPGWGAPVAPPGFHVGSPSAGIGSIRASAQPRHVAVRLMLCQACKDLNNPRTADPEGYVDLGIIKSHIDVHSGDPSITEQDLLNLCDTEGSLSNGGGTFEVKRDITGSGKHTVRWLPDTSDGLNPHFRAVGAPGEIGSPLNLPGETSERVENDSPTKRKNLLERIGYLASSTPELAATSTATSSPSRRDELFSSIANPHLRGHRKGVSEHITANNRGSFDAEKLDTWEELFDHSGSGSGRKPFGCHNHQTQP
ncbi:Stress response protein NST1 [Cladobotryum mycophilum]|uniref:Stress response protein NST1 n=1 Tax=Cladobotryum mycophilum TaxID=491253 RepID=A0ABR0SWZ8_9HYPO